jgi:CBS domain-containing protein
MDIDSNVASIMTHDVVVVSTSTPIVEAARLMVEHHLSGLPVVDGDRLVGLLTESDVVSKEIEVDPPAYGTFLDAVFRLPWDRSDDELRRVLATTAGELMTTEFATLNPQAPIHEAADLMFKQDANPVPVVDGAGRLVGIVSRYDVVRLIADAEPR